MGPGWDTRHCRPLILDSVLFVKEYVSVDLWGYQPCLADGGVCGFIGARKINRSPFKLHCNLKQLFRMLDECCVLALKDEDQGYEGEARLLGIMLFTRGRFWPLGIVIPQVCVSVSVCVCINHLLVRMITHQPFKLESPNLKHRYKIPWLRSLLLRGWSTWPLRSNRNRIIPHFELVRMTTCHSFKLASPNLDKKGILVQLWSLLILGIIDLQFQL